MIAYYNKNLRNSHNRSFANVKPTISYSHHKIIFNISIMIDIT